MTGYLDEAVYQVGPCKDSQGSCVNFYPCIQFFRSGVNESLHARYIP